MKAQRVVLLSSLLLFSVALALGAYTSGVFGLSRPAALTQDALRAALNADSSPIHEGTVTRGVFAQLSDLVKVDSPAVLRWARGRSWSWGSTTGPVTTVRLVRVGTSGTCGLIRRLYARFHGPPGREVLDSIHLTCPQLTSAVRP